MEDVVIDGRIILRYTLKASNVKMWIGFNCSLVRVCSEHGNERSGSVKGGHIYAHLSHYQLFKKNFATWG
jgi:hypothetical protein